MARRPRLDLEGHLYHLTARGNNRKKVFRDDNDYRHYLSKIRSYSRKYLVNIFACCLMPNHVHFLVQRGSHPLSKFMQCLQQSYTFYFNKKYQKVGHLFQGRYKSILCDRDAYFLELVRYIHLNPVRAGIVSQPTQYQWSSHQAFKGNKEWDFIDTSTTIGELGGWHNYQRFIHDGLKENYREDLHEVKEQLYLARDKVVEELELARPAVECCPKNISLAQLACEVERHFGLEEGSLRSPSRSRKLTTPRNWFLYLNHHLGGFPLTEVSRFMGKDTSRLSRQWNSFSEDCLRDKSLRGRTKMLMDRLKKNLPMYPRRNKSISHA